MAAWPMRSYAIFLEKRALERREPKAPVGKQGNMIMHFPIAVPFQEDGQESAVLWLKPLAQAPLAQGVSA